MAAAKSYPKMVVCHKYTEKKPCTTKKVTKTKTVTGSRETTTATGTLIINVSSDAHFESRDGMLTNGAGRT